MITCDIGGGAVGVCKPAVKGVHIALRWSEYSAPVALKFRSNGLWLRNGLPVVAFQQKKGLGTAPRDHTHDAAEQILFDLTSVWVVKIRSRPA